jgi:glycosyltransferase involved in cell wall biosynthesis
MITFLITACNEKKELQENLKFIQAFKEKGDEVLILLDEEKADEEIVKIANSNSDKVIFKKLNKNFSSFKNFGIQQAKYDYILHLDADEIINAAIIEVIKTAIRQNKLISGIHIPRINIINGADENDFNLFNFNLNQKGWVNWPDYQPRFINRATGMHFVNAVHETFFNHSNTVFLEPVAHLAILHIKDIEKQKKQNKFYDTIN